MIVVVVVVLPSSSSVGGSSSGSSASLIMCVAFRELYMGRLHRMANHFDDPLVLERAQQVNWVTIHRVCGELAVSRSIGQALFYV